MMNGGNGGIGGIGELHHSHSQTLSPRTPYPATRKTLIHTIKPRNSHPVPLHHTHLPSNAPNLKHSNPKTHFLDGFATGL